MGLEKLSKESPYEIEKIKAKNGGCIKCENGSLSYKKQSLTYSLGANSPKYSSNITTYVCNSCDYYYINQKHVNKLKNIVK